MLAPATYSRPLRTFRPVASGDPVDAPPAMKGWSAVLSRVPVKIAPVPVRETKNRPLFLSKATPSGLPSAVGIVKIVGASAPFPLPFPLP